MQFDFQVLGVDDEHQIFMGQVFNGDVPIIKQIHRAKQIRESDRVRSELRGLYRVLIEYPVKSEQLNKLPDNRWQFFKTTDPHDLKVEKMHYIVRFDTGFVKTFEGMDGKVVRTVKSTSDESITNDDLSKLTENVMDLFISWGLDMEGFMQTWHERRILAGKE